MNEDILIRINIKVSLLKIVFQGGDTFTLLTLLTGKLTKNKLTRKNTSKINIFSYIKQVVFNKSDMYPLFQE